MSQQILSGTGRTTQQMPAKTGFIFPGQGSQHTGMMSELAEIFPVVKDTFNEASEALGYDLWTLCQQGPAEELSLTHITQPAILTASIAVARVWQSQGGCTPDILAGHSLGEYSALTHAGVFKFPDAVTLVKQRGEFMQNAVPVGVGSMAAIIGLEDSAVEAACTTASQPGSLVAAVNYNAPGQVVIAGHKESVDRAIFACKEAGAKRALPLTVSAPFHSALMQPAADNFARVIEGVTMQAPRWPVLQNHGLQANTSVAAIRESLVAQIYNPVPWVATISAFAGEGVTRVIELGPGKVLCGLNKRIAPEMQALAVNDKASLEAALAS
jgi:[acyl-carrier-protein] S-malonyltransferase